MFGRSGFLWCSGGEHPGVELALSVEACLLMLARIVHPGEKAGDLEIRLGGRSVKRAFAFSDGVYQPHLCLSLIHISEPTRPY